MTFKTGDRVRTTVDAPAAGDSGHSAPAGSFGTIVSTHPGYGVLLDSDPDQIPAAYTTNELEPAHTELAAEITRERAAAPGLAKRYDDACERITELHEETARQRARIWDLEAETRSLQATLGEATHFLIGPYRIGRRRDQWQVWADMALTSLTEWPEPQPFPTLAEALAHAHHLAATPPTQA